eukprot:TRINITY_DN10402_c0_g1_i1.p1 TRINITY_DN10402_c0_g1~~TRINITY_DN10402_c0_g1_i1.p1  ORF type:complete len:628 (+),score=104.83 TRINITY_DN10402_c0_g1_i1:263-2146(+)
MCGIFAYLLAYHHSQRDVLRLIDVLIKGLKRLEYRGYDSAGLLVDYGDDIFYLRSVGPVEFLEYAVHEKRESIPRSHLVDTVVGLAHTRWATHGGIHEKNAHPHHSGDFEFSVVHNGIISNYVELKDYLTERGYSFSSDTDTEVVAKLAHYIHSKQVEQGEVISFVGVVEKVVSRIEGHYALLFSSRLFPNELCATKFKSPLLVGQKTTNQGTEVFFSSDVAGMIEHTQYIQHMEDNEIVHVTNEEIISSTRSLTYKFVPYDINNISLMGYSSYMEKEIFLQPNTVRDTYSNLLNDGDFFLPSVDEPTLELIKSCTRIILIACGTSYHSCIACQSFLEEELSIPVQCEVATMFTDRNPGIYGSNDVCIFVSQSGETADTLCALDYCQSKGSLCIGITNSLNSTIAHRSDCHIPLNAGIEIGVGSTKAYTSQIVALLIFGMHISRNKVAGEELLKELRSLPKYIQMILEKKDYIKEIASQLRDATGMIIIGRGYHYATSKEASLKIKEISYLQCEGIYAGELKHGSLALVDKDMPIFIIATQDNHYDKMQVAYQQVIARQGLPFVLCSEGDQYFTETKSKIEVPTSLAPIQTILNIIPFQLISLYLAETRNLNVDKPRNLAKSVTVTD